MVSVQRYYCPACKEAPLGLPTANKYVGVPIKIISHLCGHCKVYVLIGKSDVMIFNFCRLLRNRVSAQQARERKKSYVSTVEEKVHDQDTQLAQMRQRVQTLERENGMLRQVIKNIKGSNKDAMLVPSAKSHPDAARVPVLGES